MNSIIRIKRVMMLLSIVGITPLYAMENNQKKEEKIVTTKAVAQKVKKQKHKFVPGRELLRYPADAHIEIDEKKLPGQVIRLSGNTFIVPIGMDATLIHKELVPQRIADMPLEMII